jgi:hypothetical protein
MGCIPPESKLAVISLNTLFGAGLGIIIPSLMYAGGSSKYLLTNEIASTKEVCSMPKNTQFKCAVYKNGELLQNLPLNTGMSSST